MSPFSIELAQPDDFEAILALQTANHLTQLPEDKLGDGFVTTRLSLDTMAAMRANQGIWVARTSTEELAAYVCANDWKFYGDGNFQQAVQARLPLDFDGHAVATENSFQYGPVCVAEAFRNQGILAELVRTVRAHYAPRFEFGLTFIDIRNARSLAAHERKLGFRRLALLPAGDVTYHMLAFETR